MQIYLRVLLLIRKTSSCSSQITVAVENEEVAGLSLLSPMTENLHVCVGSFTQLTSGVVNVSSGNLLIVFTSGSGCGNDDLSEEWFLLSVFLAGMDLKPGETYVFKFKLNANRETLEIASFSVQIGLFVKTMLII